MDKSGPAVVLALMLIALCIVGAIAASDIFSDGTKHIKEAQAAKIAMQTEVERQKADTEIRKRIADATAAEKSAPAKGTAMTIVYWTAGIVGSVVVILVGVFVLPRLAMGISVAVSNWLYTMSTVVSRSPDGPIMRIGNTVINVPNMSSESVTAAPTPGVLDEAVRWKLWLLGQGLLQPARQDTPRLRDGVVTTPASLLEAKRSGDAVRVAGAAYRDAKSEADRASRTRTLMDMGLPGLLHSANGLGYNVEVVRPDAPSADEIMAGLASQMSQLGDGSGVRWQIEAPETTQQPTITDTPGQPGYAPGASSQVVF